MTNEAIEAISPLAVQKMVVELANKDAEIARLLEREKICFEAVDNKHQAFLRMETEIERLRGSIAELAKVWWSIGTDLDKDAVAQQCLKLFRLADLNQHQPQ